jgi:lysozyme family protein
MSRGAHTGLEPCNSFQRHCDKITSVPITEVKMLMAPRDRGSYNHSKAGIPWFIIMIMLRISDNLFDDVEDFRELLIVRV